MRSKAWIARNNIAMFQEKLDAEKDEAKRHVLARLLREEEQKLQDLGGEEDR